MAELVQAFKTDCLNKHDQSVNFVNNMREYVINPLRDLIKEQNKLSLSCMKEGKQQVRSMKMTIEKLSKYASSYWQSSRTAEDFIQEYDSIRYDNTVSNSKKEKLFQLYANIRVYSFS